MYANNNLYFVGNLVTEIYIFQEEIIIYVCMKKRVFPCLFAFGFVIPWEAYLGNIYPAPTEVSAISSCISLVPFTPISSSYPFVWFTVGFKFSVREVVYVNQRWFPPLSCRCVQYSPHCWNFCICGFLIFDSCIFRYNFIYTTI